MTIERTAIERRVVASLDAGRIPVLLGGCGTGRTTLMRRLADQRRTGARYIDLAAVATTPERCVAAVSGTALVAGTTARAAFDQLIDGFDTAVASVAGGPRPIFLLDLVTGEIMGIAVVLVGAGRVGVASDVEPMAAPLFAITGRGQQAIDDGALGFLRGVVEERFDLALSGREAGEVEGNALDPGEPVDWRQMQQAAATS